MNIMSFLSACRDDANQGVSKNPRDSQGGIFVALTRPFLELLEQFNFFQIFCLSSFEAVLSFVDYFRAQKVDWSLHSLAMTFSQCRWEMAEVLPLLNF